MPSCVPRDPSEQGQSYSIDLPLQRSCLLSSQSVFRLFFSSVEEGGSRGSGVGTVGVGTVGNVAGVHGGEDSTVNDVLGVGHHGGGLGPLDDGLAGNGGGDGHVVRGVNMDGGGHLHDVLLVDGDVIGDLNTPLNQDGVLDLVDLNLLLDDGSVVGNGSLEDSGDRDGKMRGGGLEDPGGVAGDEAGLAEVHLLGDHGGGLVHGGDTGSLGGGGVGSRGSRGNVVDGVGDHGAGGVLGRSEGAGQDEGECDKRPHVDGSLPLSC